MSSCWASMAVAQTAALAFARPQAKSSARLQQDQLISALAWGAVFPRSARPPPNAWTRPGSRSGIWRASGESETGDAAALLRSGTDNEAAKAFLAFMKGPEVAKVIEKYGYGMP